MNEKNIELAVVAEKNTLTGFIHETKRYSEVLRQFQYLPVSIQIPGYYLGWDPSLSSPRRLVIYLEPNRQLEKLFGPIGDLKHILTRFNLDLPFELPEQIEVISAGIRSNKDAASRARGDNQTLVLGNQGSLREAGLVRASQIIPTPGNATHFKVFYKSERTGARFRESLEDNVSGQVIEPPMV